MDNLNPARVEGIRGAFTGQPIAFVAVYHDHESPDGKSRAALGVAVANSPGYVPIPCFYFAADKMDAAEAKAEALNRDALALGDLDAFAIIASTMGGQRYTGAE